MIWIVFLEKKRNRRCYKSCTRKSLEIQKKNQYVLNFLLDIKQGITLKISVSNNEYVYIERDLKQRSNFKRNEKYSQSSFSTIES